jgi:hypothetical protein
MRFQHHPDGRITINDFKCTLDEFLVYEPAYALPKGFIGREYVPGVKHVLFTANRAEPQPLEWPEGDGYIAKVANYQQYQADAQAAAEAAADAATLAAMTYTEKRRAEYPSTQDQLDALWAGGEQAAAMKAQIDAINAKYPPPS